MHAVLTPQPKVALHGLRHREIFSRTYGNGDIGVVCWCAIGADHDYVEWSDAGRPDTSGRPNFFVRKRYSHTAVLSLVE